MDIIKKYLLERSDQITCWIGCIGFALLIVGWTSALFLLFSLLIIFPDAKFSSIFNEWAKKLKK